MLGELEIDIGFTGTRNAVKQFSVSFDFMQFGEGLFLSGIKGDFGGSGVDSGGSGIGSGVNVGSGSSGSSSSSSGSSSGVGSGDVGRGRSGKFFAAVLFDAKGEKKIGSFGDWI